MHVCRTLHYASTKLTAPCTTALCKMAPKLVLCTSHSVVQSLLALNSAVAKYISNQACNQRWPWPFPKIMSRPILAHFRSLFRIQKELPPAKCISFSCYIPTLNKAFYCYLDGFFMTTATLTTAILTILACTSPDRQMLELCKFSEVANSGKSLKLPWLATAGPPDQNKQFFTQKTFFAVTTRTSGYEDRHTANAFLSLRSRQILQTSGPPLVLHYSMSVLTFTHWESKQFI